MLLIDKLMIFDILSQKTYYLRMKISKNTEIITLIDWI